MILSVILLFFRVTAYNKQVNLISDEYGCIKGDQFVLSRKRVGDEKKMKAIFLRIIGGQLRRGLLKKRKGMTLIEALVGIALVAIAVVGLAQLFTYGILINSRANRMANATFLAQQQIEFLRNLTGPELSALSAGNLDEQIDINNDGTLDYRRITILGSQGSYTEVRVLVFGPAQVFTQRDELLANPAQHRVMADIRTILAR